ncbi:hypothetical protein V7S76_12875 [Aquirufa sp. ROCK2-A2]
MKNLSIKIIILFVFITTSSFGLIEYNSIKAKQNTQITSDSLKNKYPINSLSSKYPSDLEEKKDTSKESEQSANNIQKWGSYLILGVKKILTTLIKIIFSI